MRVGAWGLQMIPYGVYLVADSRDGAALADVTYVVSAIEVWLRTYNDEFSAKPLCFWGSTHEEPVEPGRQKGAHVVVLRLVLVYESWWIFLVVCGSGWSWKTLR